MSHPDEYLRPWTIGLTELNAKAASFLRAGDNESVDHFIKLMLTGRVKHQFSDCRVILNAWHGAAQNAPGDITVTGDFDSLIGFTNNLPFLAPINILPIPLFNWTLTKNVHVLAPYTDRDVSVD